MAYTKYSLTPADNNAAPPDGAPEGMLPSAVNDTMRDMMSQIRDVGDGIRGGTYTMTAPKITGGTITGAAFTGNTFTSPIITGGSINNTPIGATTATTGAFTTSSLKGSTSGVITLEASAVAGTNTATFPAATGTVMVSGNQPAFSAYLGSNQTISSGVITKVQINTEEFDTNSNYDHVTNYRFLPTVAGYYQVTANAAITSIGTSYYQLYIYQNGSNFKQGPITAASGTYNNSVNALIYFNGSTDYIELYGQCTGAITVFGAGSNATYFQAVMVRAA
jgi:hypothetical protein